MQKFRLLFVRLFLIVMLSGSFVPYVPLLVPDTAQQTVTAHAGTSYNKATVKKVQTKLNRKGYDCGTPDGIRGSKTSDAIREYQKDQGNSVCKQHIKCFQHQGAYRICHGYRQQIPPWRMQVFKPVQTCNRLIDCAVLRI